MPYLAIMYALFGIAGGLGPGPQSERILWSAETFSRAERVDPFHSTVSQAALALLGAPYHFAGAGPGACPTGEHPVCTDCSGLVQFAYAAAGIELPHSAAALAALGEPMTREQALPGDILLFRADGSTGGPIDHCGLYIGNGLFLHAGSRGVRLDDLDGSYWSGADHPRLRAIRRVAPGVESTRCN